MAKETEEEKEVREAAEAKAEEDAALAVKKSEEELEKFSKMTFEERIEQLRSESYLIGKEDATGLSDATSARVTGNQGKLTVIRDGFKYSINLDEVSRGAWPLQAKRVSEVLGVEFSAEDLKLLEPATEQDALEKAAFTAAKSAGGTFTPKTKAGK